MPHLNLVGGEPWAETLGVMLFPENEALRRAYIARLWAGFYPKYRAAEAGEPLPEPVLLSAMETFAATPIAEAEINDRWSKGLAAGELLKLLYAISNTDAKYASWNTAIRLLRWQSGKSRAYLFNVRRQFLPVIHLWAAFTLRGRRLYADEANGYRATDDVHMFILEAMSLLQWSMGIRLIRDKAGPVLDRRKVDFWTPAPTWEPPTAQPGWPRCGRIPAVDLSPEWMARIRKQPPRLGRRKIVHRSMDK